MDGFLVDLLELLDIGFVEHSAPTLLQILPPAKYENLASCGKDLLFAEIARVLHAVDMNNFQELAEGWHKDLPDRIRAYLNGRGIPDASIDHHFLGWNGERITIPIPDESGGIAFFKFARDPESQAGPKMCATPGSQATLYGWEVFSKKPTRIIICEGEYDRLVLEARGFDAVTSTAGAGFFSPLWVPFFRDVKEAFVCYDYDEAGRKGAAAVGRLIPESRIVELPALVGNSGDVTDFFVKLKKTASDFEALLAFAMPVPPYAPPENLPRVRRFPPDDRLMRAKEIPIHSVIEHFLELRLSGVNLAARCPFHEDREPSFIVFPKTNTFHCFGCGAGGDAISFLRRSMSLSFPEALDALEKFLPAA